MFYGDEKIDFKINSTGTPVIIGTNAQLTLSFAELIATASSVVGDGGGATYGNKIFFDLSANTQVPVQRTKWDFGFYTGSDDFRVILNSSVAMMAKQIDKNDLNAVTAADTTGFSTDVIFNQNDPQTSALAYIDYPSGDLTKTAIASVSATATDNKVYIINRGKGIGSPAPDRGWKKIRVIRNASGGYTLQHADIAATTFSTVDIAKDDAYFFKYVSIENSAVDVEPKKDKWDIAWTYFSNVTNFGAGEVPYLFQDVILQNRNVEAVKVLTSTKTYEAFAESDIASLTFSTTQSTIGSDWRSGGGPNTAPAVRSDRFYVIKDGDNNYYKIRFTAMTKEGERGYPAFEYALVKKGS
ncbi:MAG: HmuY family protein [Chitinophagaceae bacterium]|nr:HmuY family protein [Chitinophagaceae bacterium]